MEVEREMAGIGIPFAAGVAAGPALLSGGSVPLFLPALLQPFLLFATAAVACLPRRKLSGRGYRLILGLLFFAAGLFCRLNALQPALAFTPAPGPLTTAALRTAARLQAEIDAIPYPGTATGPLLRAVLTGDRSALAPATVAVFRRSGASHILALSGLHLGILYLLLTRATAPLGNSIPARRTRSVLTVCAAGFYTLATGASASTQRAFTFILLGETARNLGRERGPAAVLMASLTLQLAMHPGQLATPGFQLSYLAMTGITLLYPPLAGLYPAAAHPAAARFDPVRRIWEAAALTLACQVFTAPVAWLHFHTFPKYFLLTNLLALPLTGILMTVSVVTVLLSAAGCCPELLVRANDLLASTLLFCLETIAEMG